MSYGDSRPLKSSKFQTGGNLDKNCARLCESSRAHGYVGDICGVPARFKAASMACCAVALFARMQSLKMASAVASTLLGL